MNISWKFYKHLCILKKKNKKYVCTWSKLGHAGPDAGIQSSYQVVMNSHGYSAGHPINCQLKKKEKKNRHSKNCGEILLLELDIHSMYM